MIVGIINIIAIASVLGTRRSVARRLVWTAVIVLLPVAGALIWLIAGRRR